MSYKKNTLYLHIGLHKTGTTAFQRIASQFANTPSLIYPNIEERITGDHSHNILVGYMQSHRAATERNRSLNNLIETSTHEMGIINGMFRDGLRSKCVLISAEEFSSELQDVNKAREWQEIFSSFDKIRIAIVLRRYDHLFNSVACEIVKTSFHGNMLVDKSCTAYSCYNISSLLRIIRSFDWELEIFSYDRLVEQQNLMRKLLTWCGITSSDMPEELLTTYVNRKFHRRKALFCSLLNKKSLSEIEKIALVKSISKCDAIVDDGEEFLYSPQELDAFYVNSKRLNASALADVGILDIDDFFSYEPVSANIRWSPPRVPTFAEISAAREEIINEIGIDIFHLCLDPVEIYHSR